MIQSNLIDLNGNRIFIAQRNTESFKLAGKRGLYFGKLCRMILDRQD